MRPKNWAAMAAAFAIICAVSREWVAVCGYFGWFLSELERERALLEIQKLKGKKS